MNQKDILKLLLHTVESMNESGVFNSPILVKKRTNIYGKDSSLDSLGFINLLVSFEDQISRKFEYNIDLFDELSQSSSDQFNLEELAKLVFDKIFKENN